MRKVCFTLSALWVIGGVAFAATPAELDTEIMKTIEDTNKSLASNIALRDARGSTSDAKELYDLFAEVEGHFTRRGDAPDAVDLSRKTRTLALQIVKVVADKDFDTATNAATDLSRTCKSCHTFYKKE
jgi:triphosphoribosyl-dephospho-CoA synthetase